MVGPAVLDFSPAAAHRANLRAQQAEALDAFYAVTALVGLSLIYLTYFWPDAWLAGLIGVGFILLVYPARRLLAGHYLARAWLLAGLWLAGVLLAAGHWPGMMASSLVIFPVALLALLVSPRAGLLTAAGLSLAAIVLAQAGYDPAAAGWVVGIGLAWGVTLLIWLALRPVEAALHWSWTRYDAAQGELDAARDTQADLKQAVKDLAEANLQTARLNQLLGTARRAAEEAERAKAEFVANVSHELRTPLNMVIGFAEMIMSAPKTYGRVSTALRADLAVIHRNSQHLAALIDDVLDLSQIEAGRMALTKERVALGEIIAAATEAIRPLYQTKGLYLHTEAPAGLIVACDRTRIREVLLNLLSNAGRFTERGGVTVRAHVAEGEVVISVADTGPGIALEDQARLFQPFQQADGSIRRRFGGSGLGLSISKHFVELHDGRMWLASEVGSGATIFFTLPLEPAVAGGAYERWLNPDWEYRQRTRKWLAPKPVVRSRVVVVERGTLLQRLLRRYVGETELVAVGSLAEAGQELARGPVAALLVHDLDVGRTIERIRAADLLPLGTPALVCALPEQAAAARDIGADDYLVKPVSREALLAALDRCRVVAGTILIVDDEQDAIQLFWRILAASGRGYRVLTASNGTEALAILGSDRPDAILLDLTMPGMDGFQLLAQRGEAAAWRDVPVIIMSARDPTGHPVVASAVALTRGGGLTVPQILSAIETLGLGRDAASSAEKAHG